MCDFPGGLFHPSDDKQEVAFRYAVEKINANRDILPKSRLSAQIEQIKPQDSFHASKRGESASPSFQSATKRSFFFERHGFSNEICEFDADKRVCDYLIALQSSSLDDNISKLITILEYYRGDDEYLNRSFERNSYV